MKKLSILLLCLLLAACAPAQNDAPEEPVETDLSALTIVTPKGAPVLAFWDRVDNDNYTRVAADALAALWTGDGSPDVLVSDITSGIKAIANGAGYRLAAVITFGNFYLAATGNDDDSQMNAGDSIVLFGNENMLPNKIFHYLYEDELDEGLSFVADAQTAAGVLASGNDLEGKAVDYVFVAQPAMTGALKKNENASVYADIQSVYTEKSGLQMIQAGVFVKNSLDEATVSAFLESLEASIAQITSDPDSAKEALSVYSGEEAVAQYGVNPDLALNVMKQTNAMGNNALGLGYRKAIDIKADIDAFLSVLGSPASDEEIYVR